MKHAARLLLCLALVGVIPLGAQSPDDRFLDLYGLIQQADGLAASGRTGEARERYREALTRLQQLEKDFPKWNRPIIEFRRQYLEERAGVVPATVIVPTTPAAEVRETPPDPRLAALEEEVQQLRAERELLQAKLLEALSAQPAVLDPRELARAEERAAALQRELTELRAALAAKDEALAAAARPERLEEAERALAAARENLTQQSNTVAALTSERMTLRQQLDQAIERASAAPAVKTVPDPQTEQQLATANLQITELRDRIRRLEGELTSERERTRSFASEKQLFEQQVAELRAKQEQAARAAASTAAAPPPPPAKPAPTEPTATSPAAPTREVTEDPKREKALAKYQRDSDRLKIQQLERERDELNQRLRVMTRQLDDVRRQVAGTNVTAGTDQLAILRARLEAYEARAVPYTPEEQALMKATATAPVPVGSRASQRQLRQIPTGAAALLEDARQAFALRRYDMAEGKINQALQLDERNADMLTYLAATQLEQDRIEQAEATLKRALAVDPQHADGVSLMGLLRFRQGNYDQAFDLLSQAAQLNPDNPYTQNYLGVTLSQRGQRKPAETALRRALALDPNYAEAHANLAAVYALQQPPFLELARWHYDKALSLGGRPNPEIEQRLTPAATAPAANP